MRPIVPMLWELKDAASRLLHKDSQPSDLRLPASNYYSVLHKIATSGGSVQGTLLVVFKMILKSCSVFLLVVYASL